MVGNIVLRRQISRTIKAEPRDFRMYIQRYTTPNENFDYGNSHSNALVTVFRLGRKCSLLRLQPANEKQRNVMTYSHILSQVSNIIQPDVVLQ